MKPGISLPRSTFILNNGRVQLRDHYLRTTYRVTEVDPPINIRIGEACPALDVLLEKHGARCWAFITAWNPGSKKTGDAENRRRQAELQAEVKEGGYVFYRGEGVPDVEGWDAEDSILIVGVEKDEAGLLGKKYEQAAIVVGAQDTSAELYFII